LLSSCSRLHQLISEASEEVSLPSSSSSTWAGSSDGKGRKLEEGGSPPRPEGPSTPTLAVLSPVPSKKTRCRPPKWKKGQGWGGR
jgi:hypothetical protein